MGGDALDPVAKEAVRQWGFGWGAGVGVGPAPNPSNHPARHLAGTYAGNRGANLNGINGLNAPCRWSSAACLQNCRQEISGHAAPRLARA